MVWGVWLPGAGQWSDISTTSFFTLQQCSYPIKYNTAEQDFTGMECQSREDRGSYQFRAISKLCSLVVAQAERKDQILESWDYLATNFQPMLESYQQELRKENQKSTANQSLLQKFERFRKEFGSDKAHPKLINFLMIKVLSLVRYELQENALSELVSEAFFSKAFDNLYSSSEYTLHGKFIFHVMN
jgi:hypothetical protein